MGCPGFGETGGKAPEWRQLRQRPGNFGRRRATVRRGAGARWRRRASGSMNCCGAGAIKATRPGRAPARRRWFPTLRPRAVAGPAAAFRPGRRRLACCLCGPAGANTPRAQRDWVRRARRGEGRAGQGRCFVAGAVVALDAAGAVRARGDVSVAGAADRWRPGSGGGRRRGCRLVRGCPGGRGY